uniref:Uncharacterized protein n=1 Tax=Siphoviridae sp. ctrgt10 TaxID=2826479 RepID=A0A8S5M7H9_9CAUD|nr:MAG TPA: hypothetical protein [Siphoviridae sp. ctrgt10]
MYFIILIFLYNSKTFCLDYNFSLSASPNALVKILFLKF